MPLSFELQLDEEQVDRSSSFINNVTVYGGAEENRGDAAEFMLIAKVDVEGVRTFLLVENNDPLAQLKYEFPTAIDGHYLFALLRIRIYNPATTYVWEIVNGDGIVTQAASVVYLAATTTVYKAKVNNFAGIAPNAVNGADYWDVVSDLTTLIDYGSIITHIHNDLVDVYLRDRAKDLMKIAIDKYGCSDCVNSEEYKKAGVVLFRLNGINALNWEEKSAEMEEATRALTEYAK